MDWVCGIGWGGEVSLIEATRPVVDKAALTSAAWPFSQLVNGEYVHTVHN